MRETRNRARWYDAELVFSGSVLLLVLAFVALVGLAANGAWKGFWSLVTAAARAIS